MTHTVLYKSKKNIKPKKTKKIRRKLIWQFHFPSNVNLVILIFFMFVYTPYDHHNNLFLLPFLKENKIRHFLRETLLGARRPRMRTARPPPPGGILLPQAGAGRAPHRAVRVKRHHEAVRRLGEYRRRRFNFESNVSLPFLRGLNNYVCSISEEAFCSRGK